MSSFDNHAVSVIIIVKNGEKTLKKSIESALNQSFSQIELIIVNDGSTDETGAITDRYREEDSRVVRITLPKNIGRAAARNLGLITATGNYLIFLDADDTLPDNSIEKQINIAKEFSADIVFGRFKCFKLGTGEAIGSHYTDKIVYKTMNNISLNDHPMLVRNDQIVGRLYRHEFLKENNIKFNALVRNGEDVLFNFLTISKAKNISLSHDFFAYNYTIGNYIEKATIEKCIDARNNLIEISKSINCYMGSQIDIELSCKFADYITQLERADKSFGDDFVGLKQYIAGLRPLAKCINPKVIDTLPEWRRDIIRFVLSGYSAGVLRRWKNRCLYWSEWKQKNDS